jgi:hypothetical protein
MRLASSVATLNDCTKASRKTPQTSRTQWRRRFKSRTRFDRDLKCQC